jgi:hypothetical protein
MGEKGLNDQLFKEYVIISVLFYFILFYFWPEFFVCQKISVSRMIVVLL